MERNTAQRRAIHKVLEDAGRPLGPNEIFDDARALVPGLGIATVYRAIKQLLEDGFLAQVDLPGEPPRYEVSGKQHHHHFRCSSCRKVFDLEGCDDGFKQLVPKGFRLESHELYLFGRCSACAAA
jgi:Fur family ferric uptake transcriptional regulator